MGRDYYNDLGLTRSATEVDIKKAYRKLALKYHPDKDDTPHAATVFAAVAEAYDVLADARNKGFYDLYGEEGLKRGITDGKGGRRGGFYEFSSSPLLVFCAFFGTDNPYKALNEIAESFEAMTATPKQKNGKPTYFPLEATLEEIHHGALKKVSHHKKVLTADKRVETYERTLTVDIKPGSATGTKYVFDKEGNEAPNVQPGPVVYTLAVAEHPIFSRKGSDLVYIAKIPLVKALSGTMLSIPALDGRVLTVPVTDIVKTGSTKLVQGEGLPLPGGGRGDLLVVFDVLFPGHLSEDQVMLLNACVFLPHKPSKEQATALKAFRKAYMDTLKGWSSGFAK